MKYFIFIALCFAYGVAIAGEEPCTGPGVPYEGCVCFTDGSCVDLGDIGIHPL